MTPEHREQLELVVRCDPSLLIYYIKKSTGFDPKLVERVFELAKDQARTLLSASQSEVNHKENAS
ncbi:hypothetical protein WS89_03915 [Burkholderia sp. MSMB1072]|uniref:hypothetical protein n=1 Tax=Burkholderia sp. MSMB1072 TaxID=1637871 RepID=UPI000755310D|nr:hypothetical protein [Burkholderia sp. MSMB1072]KVH64437.1 hypothetical protein WS89_03915 [Burkholderia sp. MSMB1072]